MNGQSTAQNNRETGYDGEYPGFRNNANPQQIQQIGDIWNLELHKIPTWNQPTHSDDAQFHRGRYYVDVMDQWDESLG